MQKTIDLICPTCSAPFTRRLTEHKRNEKKGRIAYCSRKCSGAAKWEHLRPFQAVASKYLRTGSDCDKFSPFRKHLSACKKRGKDVTITLEYLKELWDSQNGICPYTKWKMLIRPTSGNSQLYKNDPRIASLDRIDSSKGYIEGNIQFVCLIAQYAKHAFTEKDLIDFCEAVTNNK